MKRQNSLVLNLRQLPYPCSHFYFGINFGNRLYSKEKRPRANDFKGQITSKIQHRSTKCIQTCIMIING